MLPKLVLSSILAALVLEFFIFLIRSSSLDEYI